MIQGMVDHEVIYAELRAATGDLVEYLGLEPTRYDIPADQGGWKGSEISPDAAPIY